MSLADVENTFRRLVEAVDPETIDAIEEWCPWYGKRKGPAYDDGEELRTRLKALEFDPAAEIVMSHDEVIALSIATAAEADVGAAANAFLLTASPDRSRAVWQAPLRSVSSIRNTPKHALTGKPNCAICGVEKKAHWSPITAAKYARHGYVGEDYQLLDHALVARWFAQTEPPKPKAADLSNFRRAIKIVSDAPESATCVKVATAIKKEMGGHIDSWRYFFETLGYAGVLSNKVMPGNLQRWTNACDRVGFGRSEVPAPARHWSRGQGFDREIFETLFPGIKLPAALRAPEVK